MRQPGLVKCHDTCYNEVTMKTKLGNTIRRARKEKHLTREQLAVRLNCSAGTIGRWERGDKRPLRVFYDGLEKELGVDLRG